MTLDLAALRKPLDDVRFPNGTVHQPRPFGPAEYQLWRDAWKQTDQTQFGSMMIQIIRACYPTVTDDDLLDCTADELLTVAAHPGGKIEQVRTALKNAAAVEAAAGATPPQNDPAVTTPSSPKMSGATSSRGTRKRSAKTGSTPTSVAATGDPISSGSLSTISTTPNVSTRFAESSTTSTAPV